MYISNVRPDKLTVQDITRLLYDGIKDDKKAGDIILVFGSKSIHRVKKAAELFHSQRAPFILVSGSERRWGHGHIPEAAWMKNRLILLGVPEERILLELEADNTTENVIGSAMVLQKHFGLHTIRRILAVSAPFHMRRCRMTLDTYMPDWLEWTLCPDSRPKGQRHNWWQDPHEAAMVKKELESLVKYVQLGILQDEPAGI